MNEKASFKELIDRAFAEAFDPLNKECDCKECWDDRCGGKNWPHHGRCASFSKSPPLSPREQRIIEFFAQKWREWKSIYNGNIGEIAMRNKCADDIDNFMVEEFGMAWVEAKMKG